MTVGFALAAAFAAAGAASSQVVVRLPPSPPRVSPPALMAPLLSAPTVSAAVMAHFSLVLAAVFLAGTANAGKLDLDLYGGPWPVFQGGALDAGGYTKLSWGQFGGAGDHVWGNAGLGAAGRGRSRRYDGALTIL